MALLVSRIPREVSSVLTGEISGFSVLLFCFPRTPQASFIKKNRLKAFSQQSYFLRGLWKAAQKEHLSDRGLKATGWNAAGLERKYISQAIHLHFVLTSYCANERHHYINGCAAVLHSEGTIRTINNETQQASVFLKHQGYFSKVLKSNPVFPEKYRNPTSGYTPHMFLLCQFI